MITHPPRATATQNHLPGLKALSPPATSRRYGFIRRTKAFIKGLWHREPLLEVALEGFRGGYALSQSLEHRYKVRIMAARSENGLDARLCGMLKQGCAERTQEIYAMMWQEEFQDAVHMLSKASKLVNAGNLTELRSKGSDDVKRMTRLRIMATKLLLSNSLTSVDAQLLLAPMFHHIKPFEAAFFSHSKFFHSQLWEVLGSDSISPELRADLMQSVGAYGCKSCEVEFGPPPRHSG